MATGTNKPVGSTDPRDLLANADNLDTAVNGDAKEWTDRLGRQRATMKAVEEAVPEALVARDQAQSAANAAERARDGALAGAKIYPTEAAGRAAVADGQTFNVQGFGDTAAYQYRRISTLGSELLATYPAAASVKNLQKLIANTTTTDALHYFGDVDGEVVGCFSTDGDLHLTGLKVSVQKAIEKTDEIISTEANVSSLFDFCDEEGEIVVKVTTDGDIYMAGTGSLKEALQFTASPQHASFGSIRKKIKMFLFRTSTLISAKGWRLA